jgi:hypothetical protein
MYMDADLRKVKKLVAFMRKEGVLTLKQGDIELSLSPMAILHEPAVQSKESESIPEVKYSDDDVLFWSSPGNLNEAN